MVHIKKEDTKIKDLLKNYAGPALRIFFVDTDGTPREGVLVSTSSETCTVKVGNSKKQINYESVTEIAF
tara:strand:- start:784 stop:990 length:207 start_codon:yes stop_codon:yes gene_type:complete